MVMRILNSFIIEFLKQRTYESRSNRRRESKPISRLWNEIKKRDWFVPEEQLSGIIWTKPRKNQKRREMEKQGWHKTGGANKCGMDNTLTKKERTLLEGRCGGSDSCERIGGACGLRQRKNEKKLKY